MRVWFLAFVACACSSDPSDVRVDAAPPSPDAAPPPPPLSVGLFVSSRGSDKVLQFDGAGASSGTFAADPNLVRPVGMTFGPDGDLYVSVGDTDRVMRFAAATGASRGTFTRDFALMSPRNLNFGPDGALYVADGFLNQILRFDGTTGVFDRVFIEDAALRGPTSFTFGPDGHVYVVSVLTNRVLRFDGQSGALLGPFATTGLTQPHDVSFGPDGNLYVTNSGSTIIARFRADSGAALGPFVSDRLLVNPLGMAWGPDGNLYVANQGRHEVLRYDGASGARIGAFVAPGAGGLDAPAFPVFAPAATPALVATPRAGGVWLTASGLRPGARVLLVRGAPGGSGSIAECPALGLGVGGPEIIDRRVADESGATLAAVASGSAFVAVTVDAAGCAASPVAPLVSARPGSRWSAP